MLTCQHTHTHTCCPRASFFQIIAVLLLLFYFIFLDHSIASRAYNQRQRAGVTGSSSDWLVVSLPYSGVTGVYCVTAGLGVIRSTERTAFKWNTWLEVTQNEPGEINFRTRGESWGSSLLEKPEVAETALSPFPRLIFLCSDLLCMHTVYVSFCLDWLWRKYIYFL